MAKVQLEFINTCPACDAYCKTIKEVADKYPQEVEVKFYYAGKDFDYIRKYGLINKGTLIINGKTKIQTLSKDVIEKAVTKAVKGDCN